MLKISCKIRVKFLLYCFIMVLILVTTEKFMSLKGISDYWYHILIFVIVFSIILIPKRLSLQNGKFGGCIFFYSLMIILSLFNTMLIWKQPVKITLIVHSCVLIPLFYYPLYSIIRYISIDTVKVIFILSGVFVSLIAICQKMLYPQIQFLLNIGIRDGKFRLIAGSTLVVSAFIIAFSDLISNRKYKKTLVAICIILLYNICFIIQSRSTVFPVLIISAVLIWVKINTKFVSDIFLNIVKLILLIIVGYLAIKYIQNIVSDSINMKEASSIQRIGEINFYYNQFKKNPVLGYGLFRDDFTEGRKLTGYDLKYYVDDVGIVGYIFQFGLIGIFFMGYLTIQIIIGINNGSKKNKMLLYGILIYAILKLPFNCYLNISSAMVYVSIYLAVLEVSCNETKFEVCKFIGGNTNI